MEGNSEKAEKDSKEEEHDSKEESKSFSAFEGKKSSIRPSRRGVYDLFVERMEGKGIPECNTKCSRKGTHFTSKASYTQRITQL